MGNFGVGKWESDEEIEERRRAERKKWEEEKKRERDEEEKSERRKNELLNSEDPALDEEGYINITYCPPGMDFGDEPETLYLRCTKRYAMLLEEGFIEAEELPGFEEALREEGYEIDEYGDVVYTQERLEEIRQEWEEDEAYYTAQENKEDVEVTPKDIAEKTKDLPEEKISSLRRWFSNLIEKVFGKGR